MTDDRYTTFKDVVQRVAKFTVHDFPGIELEDLEQSLWEVIFHPRWVEHYHSPEREGFVAMLTTVAKRKAIEMRGQQLSTSPQYYYRPSDIRRILENTFFPSEWMNTYVPEDAKALSRSNKYIEKLPGKDAVHDNYGWLFGNPTGGSDEPMDLQSDVKAAFLRLKYIYRKAIFDKYALGIDPEGNRDKKRLQRGVEYIVKYLNSPNHLEVDGGPGSRHAIRNSEAQYKIKKQHED